jgi:hypothetical protein
VTSFEAKVFGVSDRLFPFFLFVSVLLPIVYGPPRHFNLLLNLHVAFQLPLVFFQHFKPGNHLGNSLVRFVQVLP